MHAAITGPARGTTFARAAAPGQALPCATLPLLLVNPAHQPAGAAAAAAATAAAAAAAATSASPLYHGVLVLGAPELTPRPAVDGRFMGVVQPPAHVALAIASLPQVLWQQQVQLVEEEQQQRAAAAAAAASSSSSSSAASTLLALRPKLVLAVDAEGGSSISGGGGAPPAGTQRALTFHPPVPIPSASPFLLAPLGLTAGSGFSVSLFANLLGASRDSLLANFDPLATYLHLLRSTPGLGGRALFFPSLRLDPASGLQRVEVGMVLRRVPSAGAAVGTDGGGHSVAVAMAPLLAQAAEMGAGLVTHARLGAVLG